jgi:hypothetical protein
LSQQGPVREEVVNIEFFPLKLLREYSREFPGAWRQIARFREDRGKELPWWPDWCYCPIAGTIAILTGGALSREEILARSLAYPPAVMAALAAWRITKGVYRFDPALLTEIMDMPLDGALPAEVFLSLPEWCVWVEIPPGIEIPPPDDTTTPGSYCIGFFAHLEYDANDSRTELRIVGVFRDGEQDNAHFIGVHIGNWSLAEGVKRAFDETRRQSKQMLDLPELSEEESHSLQAQTTAYLVPLVNMVLYICSANADFGDRGKPVHPSRKPSRKGKIFAAQDVQNWDVGVRIGAALKRARQAKIEPRAEGAERTHSSPRPHYRRAHWHHFWTGPRTKPGERKLILKWLPPIPVGIVDLDDDESPAVVHRVEE